PQARGVSGGARAGQPERRVRAAREHDGALDQARGRRPARRPLGALPPLSPAEMNTRSPTDCPAWAALGAHAEQSRGVHLREHFAADGERARHMTVEAAGVRYDYSRQRLGVMTLRLLAHLAEERGFDE